MISGLSWQQRRRSGGVCLLTDVGSKELGDIPFFLEKNGRRFRQSKNTLTIPTHGSVLTARSRRGRDKGTGGWAFIAHGTEVSFSRSEDDVTNNQMELMAVI